MGRWRGWLGREGKGGWGGLGVGVEGRRVDGCL